MNIKIILISFIIIGRTANAQKLNYCRNFDYSTMQGHDTLKDINALPNHYVICRDDNFGKLVGIRVVRKMDWEWYRTTSNEISVSSKFGGHLMFFGSGKQRRGHTRGLFPKKTFTADSAFAINDTFIFKNTTPYRILIQFFTNIKSDSILFSEVIIPLDKKQQAKSRFSSFAYYKDWLSLDESVSEIIGGTITLKSDTILIWKGIKPSGSTYRINVTKERFKDKSDMPKTLFWLKNSGIIY
jgi:hypothetical protein